MPDRTVDRAGVRRDGARVAVGSRGRFWRSLLAAVVVLPAVYCGSVGLTGVPAAEGCAGVPGFAGSAWGEVHAALLDGVGRRVPTANDGFHYLTGHFYNMTDAEAVSSLVLDVRDGSGQALPGALFMIRTRYTDDGIDGWVGWRSASALAAGACTASLSATTPTGPYVESYALDVSGAAPTPLGAPTVSATRWFSRGVGAGPGDLCMINAYCNLTQPVLGSIAYHIGVELQVAAPAVQGTVFWEYSFASLPVTGSLFEFPAPETLSWSVEQDAVAVTFGQQLASYCVQINVRDLVSGGLVSAQTCFPTGAPTSTFVSSDVCQCEEPLPEVLRARWCAECASSDDPACPGVADAGSDGPDGGALDASLDADAPSLDSAGEGPDTAADDAAGADAVIAAGGSAGAAGAASVPDAGGSAAGNVSGGPTSASRAGCACSAPGGPPPRDVLALLVVTLLAGVRRARRTRPSPPSSAEV